MSGRKGNIMDWLSAIGQIFERLSTVRALVGFVLVFFLPGFAWTLVFFKQINAIERIALSFGMSIALVTLSIIGLNVLLGMRITGFTALLTISVLTAIPLAIYYLGRLAKGRSSGDD